MNDIVVLPVVLVLIAVALGKTDSAQGWLEFLAKLFLLGPVAGFVIGGASAWLMSRLTGKAIRRVQALYGVGWFSLPTSREAIGRSSSWLPSSPDLRLPS
jgi:NhaP-type Na+/H+ or K+/H+ antiporter